MLALDRNGVGVNVTSVASVPYESNDVLELFDVSEQSVPAVNGLLFDSLRGFRDSSVICSRDRLLSLRCRASHIDVPIGLD